MGQCGLKVAAHSIEIFNLTQLLPLAFSTTLLGQINTRVTV